MPVPELDIPDGANDPENRRLFVLWTQSLLEYFVTNELEDGVVLRPVTPELTEAMRLAWSEVSLRFEDLVLRAVDLDREMVALHGLGGVELRFKLATVAYWSRRVNAAAILGFRRVWLGYIRRLLDSVDTLLDSLLNASNMGTAIKEFKDAVNGSISDYPDPDIWYREPF